MLAESKQRKGKQKMNDKPLTKREKARLKKELKRTILMLPLMYVTMQVYAYMIGEALVRYFK